MSRVGKVPIPISQDVTIKTETHSVTVEGPKGSLSQRIDPMISVKVIEDKIIVSRSSDKGEQKALHGLTRALIANMVTGVTKGFRKTLAINGIGYRVQESGQGIVLQVGFSHTVDVQPIDGTIISIEGNNIIHIDGVDKQRVGEMAAQIRSIRPPNAYTGKGIRYQNEIVSLKPGKSAGRVG